MEKLTPYIDGFMKEITAIKDLTPAEQVYRTNIALARWRSIFAKDVSTNQRDCHQHRFDNQY